MLFRRLQVPADSPASLVSGLGGLGDCRLGLSRRTGEAKRSDARHEPDRRQREIVPIGRRSVPDHRSLAWRVGAWMQAVADSKHGGLASVAREGVRCTGTLLRAAPGARHPPYAGCHRAAVRGLWCPRGPIGGDLPGWGVRHVRNRAPIEVESDRWPISAWWSSALDRSARFGAAAGPRGRLRIPSLCRSGRFNGDSTSIRPGPGCFSPALPENRTRKILIAIQ